MIENLLIYSSLLILFLALVESSKVMLNGIDGIVQLSQIEYMSSIKQIKTTESRISIKNNLKRAKIEKFV